MDRVSDSKITKCYVHDDNNQDFMQIPAIAIHGGSGTIVSNTKDPESEKQYLKALNNALDEGYKMLTEGCSATECVCKAVTVLEDCDLFNAGKGSVFTANGQHEMDAAIMDGKTLKAGAVAGDPGRRRDEAGSLREGSRIGYSGSCCSGC